MAARSRGIVTRIATAATAIAATSQSSRRGSPDGSGRSSSTDALEKTSRSTSVTAWITVLTNESIAPEATAVVGERPWRWKKRMFTESRARFEGSATFM